VLAFFENLLHHKAQRLLPLNFKDAIIAVLLACLAIVLTAWGMSVLGANLWKATSFNLWFQADTPRVIANFTQLSSNHYRVAVHPMAPAMLSSIVTILERAGLQDGIAARALIYGVASAAAGLFFIALRLLDLPRIAALVFSGVFLASATFIHWAAIAELNVPSMLTVIFALMALALGRAVGPVWWTVASAATMGVTITNWSVGLIATFVRWPFRQFVVISSSSLALVAVVAMVQFAIFSNARPFFLGNIVGEARWIQPMMEDRGGGRWNPLDDIRSMFVTTLSAPTPEVEVQNGDRVVTNQKSGYLDRSALGRAVATAWLMVFAVGIWGGVRERDLRPVVVGLGLMIVFQTLLHCVYGDPTFLYAPHFLPILVMIAALSWFTPARWFALALAGFVAVGGGIDNAAQFKAAAALADQVIREGGNPVVQDFPAGGAILP
jgi:hypothetical protein